MDQATDTAAPGVVLWPRFERRSPSLMITGFDEAGHKARPPACAPAAQALDSAMLRV